MGKEWRRMQLPKKTCYAVTGHRWLLRRFKILDTTGCYQYSRQVFPASVFTWHLLFLNSSRKNSSSILLFHSQDVFEFYLKLSISVYYVHCKVRKGMFGLVKFLLNITQETLICSSREKKVLCIIGEPWYCRSKTSTVCPP